MYGQSNCGNVRTGDRLSRLSTRQPAQYRVMVANAGVLKDTPSDIEHARPGGQPLSGQSRSATLDGRFASQSSEGRRWHIRAVMRRFPPAKISAVTLEKFLSIPN